MFFNMEGGEIEQKKHWSTLKNAFGCNKCPRSSEECAINQNFSQMLIYWSSDELLEMFFFLTLYKL